MNKQILIIGAGITGAVCARMLGESGHKITVLEKRPYIGGNCYDYKNENGIFIHKYGPHIFRTDNETLWAFLSRFTAWQPYHHKVEAYVDGKYLPVPFNLNSLYKALGYNAARIGTKLIKRFAYGQKVSVFELLKENDPDIKSLGQFIYDKIFKNYTFKQWGLNLEELSPQVAAQVPVIITKQDGYFTEKYQAIPLNGYTKLFKNLLAHPNITVKLNTPFKHGDELGFDTVIYTGPIDEFFGYKYGALPYRSLVFKAEVLPCAGFKQNTAVVNYPNDYDYTRITEYKHFLPIKTDKTVLVYEYPLAYKNGENEPYYPIPTSENEELYKKYLAEAEKLKNFHFAGRLGAYKYYNMANAALDALALAEKIK